MSFFSGSETEQKPSYGQSNDEYQGTTKPSSYEDNAGSDSYQTPDSGYGGKVDTDVKSSYTDEETKPSSGSPGESEDTPSSYAADTPSSYETSDKPSSYDGGEEKPSSYDETEVKPSSQAGTTTKDLSSYDDKPSSYDDQPSSYDDEPSSYDNQPASEDKPSSYDDQPSSYDDKPSSGDTPSSYDDKPSSYDDKPSSYDASEEKVSSYATETKDTTGVEPSYTQDSGYGGTKDESDQTYGGSTDGTYSDTQTYDDSTKQAAPKKDEDEWSTGEKIAAGVAAGVGVVAAGAAGYAVYEHYDKDDVKTGTTAVAVTAVDPSAASEDVTPPKKSGWF